MGRARVQITAFRATMAEQGEFSRSQFEQRRNIDVTSADVTSGLIAFK